MTKQTAVIHYKAAVAVFERWLAAGMISVADLTEIETMTAEKYGLSARSIYRRTNALGLYCAID